MIETQINALSDFLTISQYWIPDILTLICIAFFLVLAFKSSLTTLSLIGLFTALMGVLEAIGIQSVHFNIVSIIVGAF